MTILRLIAAFFLVAAMGAKSIAQDDLGETDSFNPMELDNLEMFLESVRGLAVATNTSQEAYDRTGENTDLDEIWSDEDRFPHGTVRWLRPGIARAPIRRRALISRSATAPPTRFTYSSV